MAIPKTIQNRLPSGIIGEIAFDGPTRARTGILSSSSDELNVFGSAYTWKDVSTTEIQAGGAGAFAGIMINPKANGIALTVPNGEQSEFLDMGEIYAVVTGANASTAMKTPVYFVAATGALTTVVGSAPANTLIPNCVIERNAPTADVPGLCVLRLTN
jgi:hypothetical protein